MGKLAIFASGRGSNALAIIERIERTQHEVGLIVSNNSNAGVCAIARQFDIPLVLVSKMQLRSKPDQLLQSLKDYDIEFVALAGFLLLIPKEIIRAYKKRIFNIHPSLLPEYGGKGMYGKRIHEEVLRDTPPLSGISIHEVNERYDEGELLFQASCPIVKGMQIDELMGCIHRLEHRYYPEILLLKLNENTGP